MNWFQSTHSLRSATHRRHRLRRFLPVSIHALLAECDEARALKDSLGTVSIHALLAECDGVQKYPQGPIRGVSIHALLAECDRATNGQESEKKGFNPRTPCGVRRMPGDFMIYDPEFQSTHSLRSATLAL